MKFKALLCIGAVAYGLAAITANGQSFDAKLISVDPSLTIKGTFDGGTVQNRLAGVANFTTTSQFGNVDFDAFCVEPLATISVGQTLTYEVTSNSQLTNADKVAKLVGGFLSSSQSNADAAAVQWAIWEVTFENSSTFSLSNGNVNVGGSNPSLATRTLGNQYLTNINSYTAANIQYLTNSKFQNMVSFGPVNAIPEPSSLGLLALSSALMLRRKRK